MTEKELRLRIIQINDVYKLDKFAPFKSLVDHYKTSDEGGRAPDKTIVVLAGDFLGPSILSSLDRGRGMVDMLNVTGVTHVCFGNHECDIAHEALTERVKDSNFTWVNTNMRQFDEKFGATTSPCDVFEVTDGKTTKKVAVLGLLTEDPCLYLQGLFGGVCPVDPIVDSAQKMVEDLKKEKVDLFIPLTHQEIDRDRAFAEKFSGDVFPVIIGGHEHDVFDEVVNGCRISKVGVDAQNSAIIDIDWVGNKVTVSSKIIPTSSFPADETALKRIEGHHQILRELEGTKLFKIENMNKPDDAIIISTDNNRLGPSSGCMILITILRKSTGADCAVVQAGAIRGRKNYRNHTWFTFSDLKAELPYYNTVHVVPLPGKVLSDSIAYSRQGAYVDPPTGSGAYFQTCDAIEFDDSKQTITSIRKEPFDPDKIYQVAMPVCLLNGMDRIKPLMDWVAQSNYTVSEEAGRPDKVMILEYFVASIWMQLGSFADIDKDNNGLLTEEEIKNQAAVVFGEEMSDIIMRDVIAVADTNKDGLIQPEEMLATRYVAQDLINDDRLQAQASVEDIAAEVLGGNSTEEIVKATEARLDVDGDGVVEDLEGKSTMGNIESSNYAN